MFVLLAGQYFRGGVDRVVDTVLAS